MLTGMFVQIKQFVDFHFTLLLKNVGKLADFTQQLTVCDLHVIPWFISFPKGSNKRLNYKLTSACDFINLWFYTLDSKYHPYFPEGYKWPKPTHHKQGSFLNDNLFRRWSGWLYLKHKQTSSQRRRENGLSFMAMFWKIHPRFSEVYIVWELKQGRLLFIDRVQFLGNIVWELQQGDYCLPTEYSFLGFWKHRLQDLFHVQPTEVAQLVWQGSSITTSAPPMQTFSAAIHISYQTTWPPKVAYNQCSC